MKSNNGNEDTKKRFNDAYDMSMSKISEVMYKNPEGEKVFIDLDESHDWIPDETTGEAMHLTIEFPKKIRPDGKIVIGYMSDKYKSHPVSLPFDRNIHVIRGELTTDRGSLSEGDRPISVKAGEMFKIDSSKESIILIELKEESVDD